MGHPIGACRRRRLVRVVILGLVGDGSNLRVAVVVRPAALALGILARIGGLLGGAIGRNGGLPVGDRDAIIVGMDLAEGEEAVTVAAIFDESGLERGLHPRHAGKVDVAFDLLLGRGLEIEFVEPVTAEDNDPGLFRMGRVDEHQAFCHRQELRGAPARPRDRRTAALSQMGRSRRHLRTIHRKAGTPRP